MDLIEQHVEGGKENGHTHAARDRKQANGTREGVGPAAEQAERSKYSAGGLSWADVLLSVC